MDLLFLSQKHQVPLKGGKKLGHSTAEVNGTRKGFFYFCTYCPTVVHLSLASSQSLYSWQNLFKFRANNSPSLDFIVLYRK